MRSSLLYYRKHHGWQAWLAKWLEKVLYRGTVMRNRFSRNAWRLDRAQRGSRLSKLMDQAWQDTQGGRVSPPRPW